jgi:hypothetical protein
MRIFILSLCIIPLCMVGQVSISNQLISAKTQFTITDAVATTDILIDKSDDILVSKAANFLAEDLYQVTGKRASVFTDIKQAKNKVIILGTIGKSLVIDKLISSKKLKVDGIKGQWERFIIETVVNPLPGVKEALVVAGSDKRGVAFGTFTISENAGVSPWYYWADAPIKKSSELYINKARFVSPAPSVKYRGIFLNDEAPALRNWAKEKFGDFNSKFYEKVYELLLRNKANYLWPAMWQPSVFATDDPNNAKVANEYGIVISTTHHEPMMRYHEEWGRSKSGAWNYETNKEKLQQFWREGIERMGSNESVVALGMRGDGDEAMSKETAVDLMKTIMKDQRQIIADVTKKPLKATPQVWALYKEVQDYYDKGMRVDDDIMVLFCDDNWGNVRILPKKEDLTHPGGYGMYYHFDFVGGPVSYRWINVSQIERVWEQMNLSYEWGVKDLWIVNVGDLKPMELPISLFLDFAYNTSAIKASDLPNYYTKWASQQFGSSDAKEIGEILALSTKYVARRTPEMLKPDTYSLDNYREADRVLEDYTALLKRSTTIFEKLPQSHKDAYYQLVHFPIIITNNLNEMYIAAGKNRQYGLQSRASTNMYADMVREKFFNDAKLSKDYHENFANGKWNHMMAQTHIGYTNWNNPPVNKMPEVSYIHTDENGGLGYVVENAPATRFNRTGLQSRSFSNFDPINDQQYFVEVFNRGTKQLDYTITTKNDWIKLSKVKGSVQYEDKVYVSIDWSKAPKGKQNGEIVLARGSQEFAIRVPINNEDVKGLGFIQNNGVISIEAANFHKKKDASGIKWTVVPNLGRTHSSVTVMPSNAEKQLDLTTAPSLEYTFTTFTDSVLKIETYLSPTLNYKKNEGLLYAIAVDDEKPQTINVNLGEEKPDWEYPEWWNTAVTDHIRKKKSTHVGFKAGVHTLKLWMIDPGLVFQKFVIDGGGLKPSYLGPQESKNINP